jgi:hypothetical protein
MKNTRLTSILRSSFIVGALTIGSLASTQFASAQRATDLANVNIPFAFQTGHQTLPAGMYHIAREESNIVVFRGPGQASGLLVMNGAVKSHASNQGTIVFDRLGDKYYLRQIWTAGDTAGLECPKSRAEKEQLQAASVHAPSTTVLALNSVPKH